MSNNSRVFRWSNSDELHAMKMHAADIHSRRRAQPFPRKLGNSKMVRRTDHCIIAQ
jgi:hypothetical protein